jgi:hypothetical protein
MWPLLTWYDVYSKQADYLPCGQWKEGLAMSRLACSLVTQAWKPKFRSRRVLYSEL